MGSSEPRDEGATRPARAVVGQRWGGGGVITAVCPGKCAANDGRKVACSVEHVHWHAGGWDLASTLVGPNPDPDYSYLGMSAPPAPVGVRADARGEPTACLACGGPAPSWAWACNSCPDADPRLYAEWKMGARDFPRRTPAPPATGVPGVAAMEVNARDEPVGCLSCGGTKRDRVYVCEPCEKTDGWQGLIAAWFAGDRNFPRQPTEGVTPGTAATKDLPFTRSAVDGGLTGAGPGGQKPARFPRREVSRDGKQWVPYSTVEGVGFPFDSYRHRRVDGVVAAVSWEPPVLVSGARERPGPWVPSVDDFDLLPDAGR